MSEHVDDLLLAELLGALSPVESRATWAHVDTCPRCAVVLAQLTEEVAQLAVALPPAMPPALLREGLLQAIHEISRFRELLAPLGAFLGIGAADTEALMDDIDSPSNWEDAATPGVRYSPIHNGPAAYIVSVSPGVHVPVPTGGNKSAAFILQGSCRNAAGKTYTAGDRVELHPDEHDTWVPVLGPDLIFAERHDEAPYARAPIATRSASVHTERMS